MNNRAVGTKYEEAAADYLRQKGYQILSRNFRCRMGEIDLIAKAEGYLCFIEVKYRSSIAKGYPAESINRSKIRKITKTAEYYMLLNRLPLQTPCRFDVVAVLDGEISLIRNAFEGL